MNDAFKFNNETEFIPIIGLIASQLNASERKDEKKELAGHSSAILNNHHPQLLELIAQEMSVAPEAIQDFEL